MRLLVFGQTGQVARELQRLVPSATFLGRAQADLADPAACAAAILQHLPDAVINAAAYTAVDRAESEEDLATTINGAAPGAMARACTDLGLPLVQLSSDYVFDGSGQAPWHPEAAPAPLHAYGRSKLAGERAVAAAGAAHVVLRSSWVFSAHGSNVVKTMLRLGATRARLTVVEDQIGGPTPADSIAAACLTLAGALQDGAPGGIYHFAGQPPTSRAGFARETFARAGLAVTVDAIPSTDDPALRPRNARLDCATLATDFGIAAPDWHAGLDRVLAELQGG